MEQEELKGVVAMVDEITHLHYLLKQKDAKIEKLERSTGITEKHAAEKIFLELWKVDKEKVEVYENILHSLHFAASVTMDRERVGKILDKIGAWSYSHRQGNGELSCEEQEAIISKAFEKLREV